jgi:hypothetical protein
MISVDSSLKRWNYLEMKISLITLLAFLFAGQSLFGQAAIGTWTDYLNYSNTNDLDILEDEVYVSAGNTIFILNTTDNSLRRLNRITGLSDVGISTLRANEDFDMIIVGYINGNLDIIQNNRITNITDIKNSTVAGDKRIRHITFYENSALISTGVGIIDFNLERLEVKDTYNILATGGLSINETAVLNDTLYAATEEGLYVGSLDRDLTIFTNWMQDLSIPAPFESVRNVAANFGNLYINQPDAEPSGLYFKSASLWLNSFNSDQITNLRSTELGLSLVMGSYGEVKGEDGSTPVLTVGSYSEGFPRMQSLIPTPDGQVWIADQRLGLVNRSADGAFEFIFPDGPATNRAFDIDVKHGQLWVASGAPNRPGTWNNNFVFDGFYVYQNGSWLNFIKEVYLEINEKVFADIAKVYISPSNPQKGYAGSYFKGMLQTNQDEIEQFYDYTNSSLQQWTDFDDTDWTGVAGIAEDNDRNIWVTNSYVAEPLSVKTPDGNWQSFDCSDSDNPSQGLGTNRQLLDLIIDENDQKWAIVNRDGIIVFSEGADLNDSSDEKARLLQAGQGEGGLPANEVLCLAEDLDGEIWVGTTEGIAVFYSPFDVLTDNFSDARQILVEQDGVFQFLLDGQSVSAVAIDGANRKWISTFGSGVFLMSEDGTEQIRRFTTDNSPLLSDVVNDIAIDQTSGEVFFATDEGIVSYVSDAVGGNAGTVDCSSVYPNPVRETYTGPISITGLTRDADVKITDVRGNLIFSTVSNGGKAIWDGRNSNGERVATGVYYALSSNPDGSSKCTTKILVIK